MPEPAGPTFCAVFTNAPSVAALEAVRISGACMSPTIHDGDTVIVDTSRRFHAQDGDVVAAVLTETQERIVRRVEFDGPVVRLVADADGYAPVEVTGDRITIVGVVTHGSYPVHRRERSTT